MKETEIDTQALRALLLEKRRSLLAAATHRQDSTEVVELDQTRVGRLSRMDAMQAQAMAQETQRRDRLEINRVVAALQRFDSDEYGYCLRCGEIIAAARLQVDPAATLCISCASAVERDDAAGSNPRQ